MPTLSAANVRVRSQQSERDKCDKLAVEVPVALVYNGISHAVMMLTPQDLEDFALGFSLSEGIVKSVEQIHDIDIAESEYGIELQLQIASEAFANIQLRRRQMSGRSGCGLCGIESLQQLAPKVTAVTPATMPAFELIDNAILLMQDKQALQKECGAVHAAAWIANNGDLLCLREDVGRHNAFDKLLGARSKYKFDDGFALLSSRASYELLMKAANLNVATLATVSAPTSLALELARKANINLLGFVREGKQVIYNQAQQPPNK